MKRFFIGAAVLVAMAGSAAAQGFTPHRICSIHAGMAETAAIARLSGASQRAAAQQQAAIISQSLSNMGGDIRVRQEVANAAAYDAKRILQIVYTLNPRDLRNTGAVGDGFYAACMRNM